MQRLVNVTMENIKAESPGISSELGFGRNDSSDERVDPTQIALARAQRVDVSGKIDASIK